MKRNRTASPAGGQATGRGRKRRGRWVVGLVLAAVALGGVAVLAGGASAHPPPRPGVTGQEVVDHSQFHGHPRIESVYRQAREIPHVLDGLHCYCECASHSGHYSLLDCFKSDHGAGCDVCMTSTAIAHQLAEEGKLLDEIREAIDDYFGR